MMSYLVSREGQLQLFCGNTIFYDGKILVSDTHDCNVQAYSQSLRTLAGYPVRSFPATCFGLRGGLRPIYALRRLFKQAPAASERPLTSMF